MYDILLLLQNKENQRLLAEHLRTCYSTIVPTSADALDSQFDLCILDGPILKKVWPQLAARRRREQPVFLPALLVTTREEAGLAARRLWEVVDDLLLTPVERAELDARVRVLLRARQFSLELRLRNEDMEALLRATLHDLRAPARASKAFAQAVLDEHGEQLSPEAVGYLQRVLDAAGRMHDLLDALHRFLRIGYGILSLGPVPLRTVLEACLLDLREQITASGALVELPEHMPVLRAEISLLRTVVYNLLSNALEYVAPGTPPHVVISAKAVGDRCVVEVRDNGIGIRPEDLGRIFDPFVRLHSEEEYPGIGLGLSAVKKALELMGGSIAVESTPGKGSVFRFELPLWRETE